jgi:transcriptional regulator with XRE-family HTH domain
LGYSKTECIRDCGASSLKTADYIRKYKRFLNSLRQARKDAGLMQAEVARKLRKPQSFVSKCESGERRVDIVELVEFASLYRKPISYFAGEDE